MPLSRINAQSLTDGTIVASEIADGTITGTKLATNLDLSDSQTIRFGTDNDASITHDGTNLIIDSNNGTTLYHAGQHFFKNQFGTEDHARFSSNGAVNLYHDNAEKFRTTSTGIQVFGTISSSVGDLTMSDGNVVFASGHGIDFSATSDASGMTGELFDDYEVGTWTPAFSSTNASFSYGTRSGEYVKVGRIVFVSFRITLNSSPTGTLTNTTFVTGLPITIDSTAHFGGSHVGHYFNLNKTDTDEEPVYQQQPSDTRFEIKMCGDLQGESNLTPAQMQSNFQIRSAVTYLAGS